MSDDEMTTQPTIDTFLARLDEWGARFTNELTRISAGLEEVRKGQEELRAERLFDGLAENGRDLEAALVDAEAYNLRLKSLVGNSQDCSRTMGT